MKYLFALLMILLVSVGNIKAADNPPLQDVYVSPTGEYSAFVVEYQLLMYEVSSQTLLFSRDMIPGPYVGIDDELDPRAAAGDFISNGGLTGLWSPDGSRFAWTEGTPGTGSGENYENGDGRVGIFSVKDESVNLLPDEDGMPFDLSWSPDSQYLIYQGIGDFGTGAGPSGTGVYLVKPNNERQQIDLKIETFVVFHGWLLDHILLYGDFSSPYLLSYDPSASLINDVVPLDPSAKYLYDLPFWFDPSSGHILFSMYYPGQREEPLYIAYALYMVDVKTPSQPPRLVYQPDASQGRSIVANLQFLDSDTIYLDEAYYNDGHEMVGLKKSLLNIIDGTLTTFYSYRFSR